MPSLLKALLRWPAFVLGVCIMLWANTLAALFGYIRIWQILGQRNDTWDCCKFLADAFRVRVVRVGRGQLYRGGPCVYLCNHRSWADFFLDLLVLEARALTLSRLLVLFVFPTTLLSGYALRAVIFFKRGRIADKEAFNRWLDVRRAKSPYPGLLVYPEGHRSTRGQSLPLKRGMLRYTFDRQLPVQIVTSANKDAVLSEKHLTARWNQTVGTSYSDLIDPSSFPSFDDFMRQVQEVWDRQWAEAEAADFAGLPPLPPPEQRIDYPLLIRLRQAAVVLFWLAVYLLAVVPATLRALRYAYLALGATAGPAATALLVTWTAASLWACSQPVDVRACSGKPVAVKEAEAPALAAAPPNATASKAPTAAPA